MQMQASPLLVPWRVLDLGGGLRGVLMEARGSWHPGAAVQGVRGDLFCRGVKLQVCTGQCRIGLNLGANSGFPKSVALTVEKRSRRVHGCRPPPAAPGSSGAAVTGDYGTAALEAVCLHSQRGTRPLRK